MVAIKLTKERLALAHEMHTVSFVSALVGLRMLGAHWKDLQNYHGKLRCLVKSSKAQVLSNCIYGIKCIANLVE